MKTKKELLQTIAEQENKITYLDNKCATFFDEILKQKQHIKELEEQLIDEIERNTKINYKNICKIKELEEIICELRSGRCAKKLFLGEI